MAWKQITLNEQVKKVSISRLQNALRTCLCPICQAHANSSVTTFSTDSGNVARIGFCCEHQEITVKVK